MRVDYLSLAILGVTAVFAAPVTAPAPALLLQAGSKPPHAHPPSLDNSDSDSRSSPTNLKRSTLAKCPPGKFLCAPNPINCCDVALPVPPPPTNPYHGPDLFVPHDTDVVARSIDIEIDIDDPLSEITDAIEDGVEGVEEAISETAEGVEQTVAETKEDIEDTDVDVDVDSDDKASARS